MAHAVLEGAVDGPHQTRHCFGIVFEQFGRDHDAIGVQVQAKIVVKNPVNIFVRIDVLRHQIHVARRRKHRRRVHLPLQHHLLLKTWRHVDPSDLLFIQVVFLGQCWEKRQGCGSGRRPQGLALKIFDRLDATGGFADERKRCFVVHHVHHDGCLTGFDRGVLNDGIHVPKTSLVATGHDFHDRGG